MKRTRKVKAPGRDIELTVPLGPPASAPIPGCEPAITGLFWFSDATGLYDQAVEAAYLLAEGAAGPVLGVAGLVGEDCRLPVTWTKTWTPATGTGGDPGYFEDGGKLVVYPLADTVPGALEVTAEHGGQTYGPILLTVLRYSCYCYSAAPQLQWFDFQSVFSASAEAGIAWGANPKACTPSLNSGQCTATLTLNAGYTLPAEAVNVRLSYVPSGTPGYWEFRFYMDTVADSFYVYSTDTFPKVFAIAPTYSALRIYFPYDRVDGDLTLEIECYGP